ncbi:MAG TPA: DUF1269 domain-containing protein [Methanoregulaceae archaeon]|nr:DUF1269 domain-containing protein [Methanoregulaceae archaeon]
MEKMLVVVFDNDSKAYEGSRALNKLDYEESVVIYAESVIGKNPDGTISVKKAEGDFPVRTVAGTAIGSLIGLLGGAVGVGIGAAVGAMTGGISDIYAAGVDEDFLREVSEKLTPGKYAVVADLSEEWVTPVDVTMEELGGIVFRTTKKNFEADQRAKDIGALKEEISELKVEQTKAKTDRKAKLQAKIDGFNAKLRNKQEKARQRLDQRMSEDDAKITALEKKESEARGNAKAAFEAFKAEIREDYQNAARRLKELEAEHLEKHAKKLEKHAENLEIKAATLRM